MNQFRSANLFHPVNSATAFALSPQPCKTITKGNLFVEEGEWTNIFKFPGLFPKLSTSVRNFVCWHWALVKMKIKKEMLQKYFIINL